MNQTQRTSERVSVLLCGVPDRRQKHRRWAVLFSFAPGGCACPSHAFVLAAGGESAPDVTLGFVLVKDRLYLRVQDAVTLGKAFGEILMYGGFADAEFLGGGTNGRPVLYQVLGKLAGSLFQIVSNMAPLPCCCGLSIWGRAGEYDRESCGAQSFCGQRWLPSGAGR